MDHLLHEISKYGPSFLGTVGFVILKVHALAVLRTMMESNNLGRFAPLFIPIYKGGFSTPRRGMAFVRGHVAIVEQAPTQTLGGPKVGINETMV